MAISGVVSLLLSRSRSWLPASFEVTPESCGSCPILSVEAKANDDIQMKMKKAHYGKMTF
jgi:hypothetical protein